MGNPHVDATLNRQLDLLAQPQHQPWLKQGLRGVEREALRVTADGELAMTPHPSVLGSALTHPEITTDYSEALLEFVTPARHDIAQALGDLDATHRFVAPNLGGELIWPQSMPAHLPADDQIPMAWYGTSHIGMLKHVYRRGLAMRYGRTMQCIAGIHYNYSLAEPLWQVLHAAAPTELCARDFQSERYIGLINNFRRHNWLLMYLFGASPALDAGFLHGRTHGLETLGADTLYLPYATSLRMSDLGYKNDAQANLKSSYNSLLEYMRNLARAVRTPHPPYAALGLKRGDEWWQINDNILQIENEYYATIRPKRVIKTGERPLEALCSRGVQYVEVRCIDVDPFTPSGISLETARFLDVFLLHAALSSSPWMDADATNRCAANFAQVVKQGRQPGLMLHTESGERSVQDWGLALLDELEPVAQLLDSVFDSKEYTTSQGIQREKLKDPALTPSARVLAGVREAGSHRAFGLAQARQHARQWQARPLTAEQLAHQVDLAKRSLADQVAMEAASVGSFDAFIEDYRARTPQMLCCDGP